MRRAAQPSGFRFVQQSLFGNSCALKRACRRQIVYTGAAEGNEFGEELFDVTTQSA